MIGAGRLLAVVIFHLLAVLILVLWVWMGKINKGKHALHQIQAVDQTFLNFSHILSCFEWCEDLWECQPKL